MNTHSEFLVIGGDWPKQHVQLQPTIKLKRHAGVRGLLCFFARETMNLEREVRDFDLGVTRRFGKKQDFSLAFTDGRKLVGRAHASAISKLLGITAPIFVERSVTEIVSRHAMTLLRKRRQCLYEDDYGQLVRDKWEGELAYFVDKVLHPELVDTLGYSLLEFAGAGSSFNARRTFGMLAQGEEFTPEQLARLYYLSLAESLLDTLDEDGIGDFSDPRDDDPAMMSPDEYEEFCADLLRCSGWSVQVCGGSGDQGVDLVAQRGWERAVFQCKRYSKPVGNSAVQEVHTGKLFHGAAIAAVVTTVDYTPSARAAAMQTGVVLLHHSDLPSFRVSDPNESDVMTDSHD
ncbi:MAG: restriction endonuclease [Planctomycetota bacterium]